MKDTERRQLVDLRRALLHLHKTLIDWERTTYEREYGRTPPGELLDALMRAPQFAWLRPLSELIVRIDESLEIDALDGPEVDAAGIVSQARLLIVSDEHGTPAAQRYYAALQEYPDAVFAHRAVVSALNTGERETQN